MIPMKLRRLQAGDPISVDFLNTLIDAAQRSTLNIGPSSGLTLIQGTDGLVLTAVVPTTIYGKTTGALSGGTYPFLQQFPAAAGTWTDGVLTGTAYEQNGNTGVATGTYIELERTPQGDWRFRSDSC